MENKFKINEIFKAINEIAETKINIDDTMIKNENKLESNKKSKLPSINQQKKQGKSDILVLQQILE